MAICTEDVKAIAKAPNVGPKTAARIVLELKDKVAKEFVPSAGAEKNTTGMAIAAPRTVVSGNLSDATETLMVL